MRTDDFDYNLPEELIAQEPAAVRDECRLLVMDRESGEVEDRIFKDIIEYLRPGDLLVANETRVMPARLLGAKRGTGGAAEVFLLRECGGPEPRTNRVAFWEVLVRPGKRLKPGAGAVVDFANAAGEVVLSAEIIDWARDGQRGERVARLSTPLASLDEALHAVGHTPLPPYIRDYAGDEELYQTVYSRRESSAAAPTAGLHFTPELIERLRERGIGWATVELEVGLDTFRVVDDDPGEPHPHHRALTRRRTWCDPYGKHVAVGTTSVRSLESAWDTEADGGRGAFSAGERTTRLHISPGYEVRVVDARHHHPRASRSTLMISFGPHPREHPGRLPARHRRTLPPPFLRRRHVLALEGRRPSFRAFDQKGALVFFRAA